MSPITREQRRALYRSVQRAPLDPDRPEDARLLTPLYDSERDPATRLIRGFQDGDVESAQFLVGGRGSGRSTTLLRVRRLGRELGLPGVYLDLGKHLALDAPFRLPSLAVAILQAVEEALEPRQAPPLQEEIASLLDLAPQAGARIGDDRGRLEQLDFAGEFRRGRLLGLLRGRLDRYLPPVSPDRGCWGRFLLVDGLSHTVPVEPSARGQVHAHLLDVLLTLAEAGFPHASHLVLELPASFALRRPALEAAFTNARVVPCAALPSPAEPGSQTARRLRDLFTRRSPLGQRDDLDPVLDAVARASGGVVGRYLDLLGALAVQAGDEPLAVTAARVLPTMTQEAYRAEDADDAHLRDLLAEACPVAAIPMDLHPQAAALLDGGQALLVERDSLCAQLAPGTPGPV
ncbi:MAG: hypothetical protein ABIO70_36945 [Pseudomonadota bacterium]